MVDVTKELALRRTGEVKPLAECYDVFILD